MMFGSVCILGPAMAGRLLVSFWLLQSIGWSGRHACKKACLETRRCWFLAFILTGGRARAGTGPSFGPRVRPGIRPGVGPVIRTMVRAGIRILLAGGRVLGMLPRMFPMGTHLFWTVLLQTIHIHLHHVLPVITIWVIPGWPVPLQQLICRELMIP